MQEANNYQHLILDQKGNIIQSNDQLFLSLNVTDEKASDLINFGQSIFPHICNVLEEQNLITFKGIRTPSKLLPGTYDFIFSKRRDSENELIECWVIDRSTYYQDIQQFWQKYRENALAVAS